MPLDPRTFTYWNLFTAAVIIAAFLIIRHGSHF